MKENGEKETNILINKQEWKEEGKWKERGKKSIVKK